MTYDIYPPIAQLILVSWHWHHNKFSFTAFLGSWEL